MSGLVQHQVVIIRPKRNLAVIGLAVNLLQSTLIPAGATDVVTQITNNPQIKQRIRQDWIQSRPQFYEDSINFRQDSWPNPLIGKKNNVSFINTRIDEQQVDPFVPVNIAIPIIKNKIRIDWIQSRSIVLEDEFPTGKISNINPLVGRKNNISYQIASIREEQANPFIAIDFAVPLIKERSKQDWTQNRSINLQDQFPVGAISNTNPLRKRIGRGFIFTRQDPTVPALSPPQAQWPNPNPFRRMRPKWEDYYIIDSGIPAPEFVGSYSSNVLIPEKRSIKSYQGYVNWVIEATSPKIPQIVSHIALPPQRKERSVQDWIKYRQIQETNTPIQYAYPNPIIVRYPTNMWIENLLERDLFPGDPIKPFHQEEFPNPLIGRINFPQGIQQARPNYYEDPPIQISQSDWPVFRLVRRAHAGYIRTEIPPSVPLIPFASSTQVPQQRQQLTITWIDNPQINLNEITGDTPFNQNNWPIFISLRRNNPGFVFVHPILLPNIIGRKICLLASVTEFDLDAFLVEFDLEASIVEFDLDAGGKECE